LNENKYSSLLYAEYSLELSDLSPYFTQEVEVDESAEYIVQSVQYFKNPLTLSNITQSTIIIFISGIITGMMILGLSLYANKTLHETSARKSRKGKKR